MKKFEELKTTLVFDIETVKLTKTFGELSQRMQECWIKICDKLIASSPTHPDNQTSPTDPAQLYEDKAALYPEFAKVVSISFGSFTENEKKEIVLTVDDISGHDEKYLLNRFAEVLNKIGFGLTLVAHNGKFFDLPFMCKRYIINGMDIPKNMDIRGKKPWEIKHQDTAEIWCFGNLKGYMPLNTITAVLDIPTSKDDIDGSMVGKVYYGEENGIERIATYCRKDVIATTQIYLKMNNTPIITEDNIINTKALEAVVA